MNDAREHLKELINGFSTEGWHRFFRMKSGHYSPINEDYSRYEDEDFRFGIKLGEIQFPDTGEHLLFCAFQVQKALSERSGKKAQYEKVKKILRSPENLRYQAGIFIFYDSNTNFRFSLIYPEAKGTRREWSNFKRFTYFASRDLTNKTFLQRIGNSDFSKLKNIKDAFSVEPVTNSFFEEFRIYFDKTKEEFEKTNKNTVCSWLKEKYTKEEYQEQLNKFTHTFMGRIIFIYFLQRKGWIESNNSFLKKHIEDKNNTLLYTTFFQPLFFEVFAKKEQERSRAIREKYKETPYLNGGLFEKSDLENQLDEHQLFILFDDKFIREIILNFFENYNFTIDENSPNDQEVSIDPEILGKVFENTLAEEERGKKGTFYTPREIVHYMVKTSLLRFLINETSIDHNKLHDFMNSEKPIDDIGFSKDEVRLIDRKLEHIKILDPAVGSGAFPVEMLQVLVELRKQLNVEVGKNVNEVALKKRFIKENIYGVDIDPSAIEIAKLRMWLSLIVDYDKSEAEPLPNLDFQFRLGNSLQEKIDDIDIFSEQSSKQEGLFAEISEFDKTKHKMIGIKDRFYVSENETEKRNLKKEFDELEHQLIYAVLKQYQKEIAVKFSKKHFTKTAKEITITESKIENLEQKIQDGTYKLFKPDFHFSEVFDRKDENGHKVLGFDIVIGNPPYGIKVDDDIKDKHSLGSRDSYGVFISTSLKRFLKPNGILSFIVSDTWLTIKTHKLLREQVLEKQLHRVIRLHQDCFNATVNACIIEITNKKNEDNKLIAADLTNISTRKETEDLREKLYHLDKYISYSTPKYAVYKYDQDQISINSNKPIFVGSPKLFTLMNDIDSKQIKKNYTKKSIIARQIIFNDKLIEIIKLGGIADVKVGLQTGDNVSYLFQNPSAKGNYRSILSFKKYLLSDSDLEKIRNNEDLRISIIENGISKDDPLSRRYFNGRYIIPHDKGGESDTNTGWLPNYYVPTNFFIDWSEWAVQRIKTLTIADKIIQNKEDKIVKGHFLKSKTGILRNTDYYFKYGIDYSQTGVYCPTFRINSGSNFNTEATSIFLAMDNNYTLGILCSKIFKYFIKNYIDHTVHASADKMKESPFIYSESNKIVELVSKIIEKQKINPRYDYMSNEQKEIDKLVYEMYGLNKDDIREVETWYARRYPKLAKFCDLD